MKNALLTIIFIVGAITYSFGQEPNCIVSVQNISADNIFISVITTTDTPDACPGTFDSTPVFYVPNDGLFYDFVIGVAPLPDPAIRPYKLGCYSADVPGLGSWQINECWNPICVDSDEPTFNIQFTTCSSDYTTQVVIE